MPSEAVAGFTLSDLVFTGGTFSNLFIVDADTYMSDYTATSPGLVSIGVANVSYTDLAGNGGSAGSASLTVLSPASVGMDPNDFDWKVPSGSSSTQGASIYGGARTIS